MRRWAFIALFLVAYELLLWWIGGTFIPESGRKLWLAVMVGVPALAIPTLVVLMAIGDNPEELRSPDDSADP